MRARLAVLYAKQTVELREVVLKNKPPELLAASPKATVPVLVVDDQVIDESLGIMQWALERHDPDQWLFGVDDSVLADELIHRNDNEFKPALDRYKYFDRHPEFEQEHYLQQALPFLQDLERRLIENNYLTSNNFSALDAAIFPFVRQFAHCDLSRFAQLNLPALQAWLEVCKSSDMFRDIMFKYPAWSSTDNNGVKFAA